LPVISIGVEDLDAAEAAVRAAGAEVVYGPTTEEWGLRRFFFCDPAGNLVNVVDS
jgi:predicted enzyme related to lactoylglutathione lyase